MTNRDYFRNLASTGIGIRARNRNILAPRGDRCRCEEMAAAQIFHAKFSARFGYGAKGVVIQVGYDPNGVEVLENVTLS